MGKTNKKNKPRRQKKKSGNNNKPSTKNEESTTTTMSKEELVKAVGKQMAEAKQADPQASPTSSSTTTSEQDDTNLLDRLNPFKAGQSLRQTIDTALTSIVVTTAPTQQQQSTRDSIYWMDDRLGGLSSSTARTSNANALLASDDDYVPEVLVVGALGDVGTGVVQRLLRENSRAAGQFRVRVLVPNLYTQTLERFGTAVTYSQGDLSNVDSLEYAVTDVDKIIVCPTRPHPKENNIKENGTEIHNNDSDDDDDSILRRLEERAKWAEQVDCWGMKNLVQAYQNVRHADYGTSQAAKRTLFKFSRLEDFNLFALEYDDDNDNDESKLTVGSDENDYDDNFEKYEYTEEEDYNDYNDEEQYDDYQDDTTASTGSTASTSTTQVQWIRNKFDHAVFVGRIPTESSLSSAQASISSSRLRSRENPDSGIDLSSAFAGFILRVCSDGGTYEAFLRTSAYETDGVEYVCPFTTDAKLFSGVERGGNTNKSKNKFTTVRLPFEKFQPVAADGSSVKHSEEIPPFRGQDVQQIGYRFRSLPKTTNPSSTDDNNNLQSFYLAFSYVKLYRSQPEPEFIYVSDARIPPIVSSDMVRHDMKRLLGSVSSSSGLVGSDGAVLLDDRTTATALRNTINTEEEIYYKYLGEETLKKSGLAYAVVRVKEYQEQEKDSALTEIQLAADVAANDESITAGPEVDENGSSLVVTQDQVAQVCVSALLDPGALNKSFYLRSKQSSPNDDNNLSEQFQSLPKDPVALP